MGRIYKWCVCVFIWMTKPTENFMDQEPAMKRTRLHAHSNVNTTYEYT